RRRPAAARDEEERLRRVRDEDRDRHRHAREPDELPPQERAAARHVFSGALISSRGHASPLRPEFDMHSPRRFLVPPIASVAVAASGLALVAGGPGAIAQVPGAEWHGTPNGLFGQVVASAGDVDADGADDLLVGERSYTGAFASCGRVSVYSGRTAALIRE